MAPKITTPNEGALLKLFAAGAGRGPNHVAAVHELKSFFVRQYRVDQTIFDRIEQELANDTKDLFRKALVGVVARFNGQKYILACDPNWGELTAKAADEHGKSIGENFQAIMSKQLAPLVANWIAMDVWRPALAAEKEYALARKAGDGLAMEAALERMYNATSSMADLFVDDPIKFLSRTVELNFGITFMTNTMNMLVRCLAAESNRGADQDSLKVKEIGKRIMEIHPYLKKGGPRGIKGIQAKVKAKAEAKAEEADVCWNFATGQLTCMSYYMLRVEARKLKARIAALEKEKADLEAHAENVANRAFMCAPLLQG